MLVATAFTRICGDKLVLCCVYIYLRSLKFNLGNPPQKKKYHILEDCFFFEAIIVQYLFVKCSGVCIILMLQSLLQVVLEWVKRVPKHLNASQGMTGAPGYNKSTPPPQKKVQVDLIHVTKGDCSFNPLPITRDYVIQGSC